MVAAAHPEPATGSGGAVSSAAPAATAVGLEILTAGGNAIDAAVATALVLAVVHPQAGNLGGGGFAIVRIGSEVYALDFREVAPAAASREMYVDGRGEPIAQKSLIGPLAAGVPGSPHGLFELHRAHGALPWTRVVAPAIRLAEEGFIVTPRLAAGLEAGQELLVRFDETAEVWLPGGRPPTAGSLVRLPRLASTLRAYASDGPMAIMAGPAAAIVEAVSDRHGGVLTAADLGLWLEGGLDAPPVVGRDHPRPDLRDSRSPGVETPAAFRR